MLHRHRRWAGGGRGRPGDSCTARRSRRLRAFAGGSIGPALFSFFRPPSEKNQVRPTHTPPNPPPPEPPQTPKPNKQINKQTNKQALCDAPGMVRRVIGFKQLAVTPMKIEIPRIAKKKVLAAAWKEAGES
jgi:hypothetical protein